MLDHAAPDATLHTDEAVAYRGMTVRHEAVCHGAGEYVRGDAHTNGIESFRAILKRAHKGIYPRSSSGSRMLHEVFGVLGSRASSPHNRRLSVGLAGDSMHMV